MAGLFKEAVERTEQPATENLVQHLGETVLRRVMALEQYRGQRRRQGQGVEGRDHRGNRDGQGELFVELAGQAGNERRRNEYRTQHQRRGDDRAGYLAHGFFGRFNRGQSEFDVPLDVLHHHDGVVHHDTDRQYQAEQRQGVEREAKQMHHGKGTDQRYRHSDQWNDRGAPGLQEQDHHQHHEDQRFEEGVNHRLDGAAHEDRRVIDDAEVHAFGEVLLQFGHFRPHFVGDFDGVGTRTLEDRDRHRRLVVQQRTQGVLAGTQFNASDVLEASDFTVVARANDDVLELFLTDQAALSVDRQLEALGIRGRGRAQCTGSHLTVLFTNRVDHIGGGQVARSGLVRIEPHPQRVVAHAEQLHITDTAQTRQLILDVEQGVVGQVEHVVAFVRRGQVHNHRQVGRRLVHSDTDARHFFGKFWLGPGHAVLHLHLRVVQVSTQREGDGQGDLAVSGRLRGHVQHVLDAGDRLLQRSGHGFTDDFRVGTREVGADHNGRRYHFRVFADRQLEQRDRAGDQDQQRKHRCEDRP
ncbi:hypothetical protein D3C72_851030 [compost metagenome]